MKYVDVKTLREQLKEVNAMGWLITRDDIIWQINNGTPRTDRLFVNRHNVAHHTFANNLKEAQDQMREFYKVELGYYDLVSLDLVQVFLERDLEVEVKLRTDSVPIKGGAAGVPFYSLVVIGTSIPPFGSDFWFNHELGYKKELTLEDLATVKTKILEQAQHYSAGGKVKIHWNIQDLIKEASERIFGATSGYVNQDR